jgi:glutamyl-tRNA synthetase
LRPFIGERSFGEVRPLIELYKTRAHTLAGMAQQMAVYFDQDVEYEAEAVKKHVKGDDLAERMRALHATLAATEPFDVTTTEQALRALANQRGVSAGKLIHPLRLALTGKGASPPIFDVAVTLGKTRTLRRLERFIDQLPALTSVE